MWGHGKLYGLIAVVLVIILAFGSWAYTQQLAEEREARIASLLASPEYAHCLYDESTCPQITNTIQVPNLLGIAIIIISLVLAGYLFKSDHTQQKILLELRRSDDEHRKEERLQLILSILKKEERKVIQKVREQPGITQNTLRLRTDFSKAKLSTLLKELENRELITKEAEGKTNKIYLKREL